jgi:hypothetical protein
MASESNPHLVILIRPSADRRRLNEMLAWLRWMVPAALLLVGPAILPDGEDAEVFQLDCADDFDGPLSVASMLARRQPR